MVNPGISALGSIIAGSAICTIFATASQQNYWYDIYNCYIKFGREVTEIIDGILSHPSNRDYVYLASEMAHGTASVPGEGQHRYYLYHTDDRAWYRMGGGYRMCIYIGLEKIKEQTGGSDVYYYMGWYSSSIDGKMIKERFIKKILSPPDEKIITIKVDKSRFEPSLVWLSNICKVPKPNQVVAIDLILDRWTPQTDFNQRVFLYGSRGMGKSYMGGVIKKKIERELPNVFVRLYPQYDPSDIGVDIETYVLRHASSTTPVIVIINEIEAVYEKVLDTSPEHDQRTQHTRNRSTFNDMMDALEKYNYVIVIFTSEIGPGTLIDRAHHADDFKKVETLRTVMRPGRISTFIRMENDTSVVEEFNSVTYIPSPKPNVDVNEPSPVFFENRFTIQD